MAHIRCDTDERQTTLPAAVAGQTPPSSGGRNKSGGGVNATAAAGNPFRRWVRANGTLQPFAAHMDSASPLSLRAPSRWHPYGLYRGTLYGGVIDGYGTANYADGAVYCGQWREGSWDGAGSLEASRFWCSGGFRRGHPHGNVSAAVCCNADVVAWPGARRALSSAALGQRLRGLGMAYRGCVDTNRASGSGVARWGDGCYHVGTFLGGRRDGSGTAHDSATGETWTCAWERDKPRGPVNIRRSDGSSTRCESVVIVAEAAGPTSAGRTDGQTQTLAWPVGECIHVYPNGDQVHLFVDPFALSHAAGPSVAQGREASLGEAALGREHDDATGRAPAVRLRVSVTRYIYDDADQSVVGTPSAAAPQPAKEHDASVLNCPLGGHNRGSRTLRWAAQFNAALSPLPHTTQPLAAHTIQPSAQRFQGEPWVVAVLGVLSKGGTNADDCSHARVAERSGATLLGVKPLAFGLDTSWLSQLAYCPADRSSPEFCVFADRLKRGLLGWSDATAKQAAAFFGLL
jgi:hypothetical protein